MSQVSPEQFAETRWAHAVGDPVPNGVDHLGSLQDIRAAIAGDPERFFRPPYANPYEAWCVEDHKAAAALPPVFQPQVTALAKAAYIAAWSVAEDPEVCGLFSDDVTTTYSLLLMSIELSTFTLQRATWIIQGRVPWGYADVFPNGRWLVL
jgi:hypothetical protein